MKKNENTLAKNGCRLKILKNSFIGTNRIRQFLDVFETTLQPDGEEVI